MEAASRTDALIERSKHHREHDLEGPMEASNWIRKGVRVLFDRGGDPRVGELQKQRTPGTQKDCSLTINGPGDRSRAENARERAGRDRPDPGQLAFQVLGTDNCECIGFQVGLPLMNQQFDNLIAQKASNTSR